MGVVNVSPHSFYNPHSDLPSALRTAERMVNEGALWLDIGAEATNPSVDMAVSLSPQQEIDRVVPLISAIRERWTVGISVDTSQPAVMRAAVDAGADMINDQRALRLEGALDTVVALQTPVCLMHWFHPRREPDSCRQDVLLTQIKRDLYETVSRCELAGVMRDRILIDPGFGQGHYGKSAKENFYLLAHLAEFAELELPILTGLSRKSLIGHALGAPPSERLFGSIAADTLAAWHGSSMIRTHDVKATMEAMRVVSCVKTYCSYK
ncbi:MAG: dihydropteroate synthase [Coxiella sp. RIFCSPHIGHO2_12_FULL_44_14]|nr:MAG: dihydropteroate synthase [Coxiella sp. RIFCSPHIGHO2_12_FULL_44_14]